MNEGRSCKGFSDGEEDLVKGFKIAYAMIKHE